MDKELNYIHKEVKALLEAFGYKPEVKTYTNKSGKLFVDILFHVNNGFETMPIRHKDAIRMLAKGYLRWFDYASDTQYVCLYDECKGLKPDDGRYSCLLHEIRLVDSYSEIAHGGIEMFVNKGTCFKRFVHYGNVTTEE